MQSVIRILSEETINQIAAGEVIENPASVVKELVENAVDAGAKTVKIETQGGGQHLIRVADDGCGMGRDDALLCLERYSTSKIKRAADLLELSSMGFRGEALASIAAVSRLTLITAGDGEEGVRIEVEAGRILVVEPCARRQGTTFEVRSLFFNVPARKKFQKSIAVNAAEITRCATALALAHPEVGFTLIQQDKEGFSTLPENVCDAEAIGQRAIAVIGDPFTRARHPVQADEPHCRIQGFVCSPSEGRANRTGQFLYINRRPVVCPPIALAVKDGFGTRLEANKHPAFVLHLEIPATFVDVNVHPQKREVRLREETLIKQTVQRAVSIALQGGIPHAAFSSAAFKEPPAFSAPWSLASFDGLRFKEEVRESKENTFTFAVEPKPVGVFSHYFFVQDPDYEGLVLIDLHAAIARLLFEAMTENRSSGFSKQALMLPVTLQFSLTDTEAIEACLEELGQIGVEVRKLSHQAFIIEALPSYMEIAEIKPVLENLAEAMRSSDLPFRERRLRAAAALSGRFAKAHKRGFMLQEALSLYKQLLKAASPDFCPRGKPTRIYWNDEEISKFFTEKRQC